MHFHCFYGVLYAALALVGWHVVNNIVSSTHIHMYSKHVLMRFFMAAHRLFRALLSTINFELFVVEWNNVIGRCNAFVAHLHCFSCCYCFIFCLCLLSLCVENKNICLLRHLLSLHWGEKMINIISLFHFKCMIDWCMKKQRLKLLAIIYHIIKEKRKK